MNVNKFKTHKIRILNLCRTSHFDVCVSSQKFAPLRILIELSVVDACCRFCPSVPRWCLSTRLSRSTYIISRSSTIRRSKPSGTGSFWYSSSTRRSSRRTSPPSCSTMRTALVRFVSSDFRQEDAQFDRRCNCCDQYSDNRTPHTYVQTYGALNNHGVPISSAMDRNCLCFQDCYAVRTDRPTSLSVNVTVSINV